MSDLSNPRTRRRMPWFRGPEPLRQMRQQRASQQHAPDDQVLSNEAMQAHIPEASNSLESQTSATATATTSTPTPTEATPEISLIGEASIASTTSPVEPQSQAFQDYWHATVDHIMIPMSFDFRAHIRGYHADGLNGETVQLGEVRQAQLSASTITPDNTERHALLTLASNSSAYDPDVAHYTRLGASSLNQERALIAALQDLEHPARTETETIRQRSVSSATPWASRVDSTSPVQSMRAEMIEYAPSETGSRLSGSAVAPTDADTPVASSVYSSRPGMQPETSDEDAVSEALSGAERRGRTLLTLADMLAARSNDPWASDSSPSQRSSSSSTQTMVDPASLDTFTARTAHNLRRAHRTASAWSAGFEARHFTSQRGYSAVELTDLNETNSPRSPQRTALPVPQPLSPVPGPLTDDGVSIGGVVQGRRILVSPRGDGRYPPSLRANMAAISPRRMHDNHSISVRSLNTHIPQNRTINHGEEKHEQNTRVDHEQNNNTVPQDGDIADTVPRTTTPLQISFERNSSDEAEDNENASDKNSQIEKEQEEGNNHDLDHDLNLNLNLENNSNINNFTTTDITTTTHPSPHHVNSNPQQPTPNPDREPPSQQPTLDQAQSTDASKRKRRWSALGPTLKKSVQAVKRKFSTSTSNS